MFVRVSIRGKAVACSARTAELLLAFWGGFGSGLFEVEGVACRKYKAWGLLVRPMWHLRVLQGSRVSLLQS